MAESSFVGFASDAFADLPRDSAVVCHDAGAANVIIAGLRQTGRRSWRACMQGPAARLWEAAFNGPAPFDTPAAALKGSSFLLSGTGWASSLEHEARKLARQARLPQAALVDHWVNYRQRFVRDGETELPDEVWVSDEEALRLAHEAFPELKLRQIENWYLKRELEQLAKPGIDESPELLYLAEPARSDWGRGLPGEFQALDYFASRLPTLGLPPDLRIRLRPHPSDPPGKYEAWINAHTCMRLELDQLPSMADALGRARWVAGCESYGLVLALAAGRSVYCTLPPWAPPCRLPQAGLIHLAVAERIR